MSSTTITTITHNNDGTTTTTTTTTTIQENVVPTLQENVVGSVFLGDELEIDEEEVGEELRNRIVGMDYWQVRAVCQELEDSLTENQTNWLIMRLIELDHDDDLTDDELEG